MHLETTGQYLIVRPDPAPEQVGGIIIPDSAKAVMKPKTGTVTSIGDRVIDKLGDGKIESRPFKVAIGDRILWGEYSGVPFEYDIGEGPEELRWMREDEIIGIIRP